MELPKSIARGLMPALLSALLLNGCATRTIEVTSDPPGATVVANDVELGRTPLSADFTYYGSYDVLVTKPGYEPLRTVATARAPFYEYPPVDLAAAPVSPHTTIYWHFTLSPSLESTQPKEQLESDLITRARALRDK
ncbi:MAG: PEGA domain-containing protein [Phycisphaerales bacterium]